MSKSDLHWMGRPVGEMSREELLAIVEDMARRLDERYSPFEIRARALGRVEMMKRGEA